MNLQGIAAALQRVENALRRRPGVGLHDDAEKLRSLVEDAVRCSPVPSAVRNAVPVSLNVQFDTGAA